MYKDPGEDRLSCDPNRSGREPEISGRRWQTAFQSGRRLDTTDIWPKSASARCVAPASSPRTGMAAAPDTRPRWRVGVGWSLILIAVVFAVAVPALDILQAPPAGAPPVHGHVATQATSIVHSSDAIAIAVELLLTLVVGLGLAIPGLLPSARGFALVTGLSLLYADGLLHWFAILEHVGAVPFMWFFAASGAVQIFAIPFALRWERVAWWSGVALSVFFLVLFALVLIVPEPLSVEPEGVTGLGLLSKAAELGILGGMVGYFGKRIVPGILPRALHNRVVVELLLSGAVLTAAIAGVEAFWSLLPIPVFLLAAVVLIVFIVALLVAHRRESTLAAATAWVLMFSVVLGHLLYAAYYFTVGLIEPFSLCILGAASLSTPVLAASIALRPPRAARGAELPSGTQSVH